jgi:curved DNA-binding protein CbpA
MTDYFALLEQPRSPWLDPEELKQSFHAKTRHAHPDARPDDNSDAAFAQLNEAYQVLRDPKRRLHHFLTLKGEPAAQQAAAIPKEVDELFPAVARLTNEADAVLQKVNGSSNALSRSLLRGEVVRTRAALEETLDRLRQLHTHAEDKLSSADADATDVLQDLYLRFSYLARWIAELEEKLVRLTT